MKLVIVDNHGEVHDVIDHIDGYNLDKQLARTDVMNKINAALNRILDEQLKGQNE